MAEPQYLYLTTIGRRSHQPREIEIWFTRRDGRYYVIAEYETSHWVGNIRANPSVNVRISGRAFPARARVLDVTNDQDLVDAVQRISREKYGWGEGLVVELRPAPESKA